MLQLQNNSPYSPAIAVLPDENGIDTLYVTVKATYSFNGEVTLAEEQIPPQMEDEFWGEPGQSSIKYMSEIHLSKPATDIILIGHAHAPNGMQTTQMECGIKVGNYTKKIRVFGDRHWDGAQKSQPEPFEKMPLTYENAFGGSYIAKAKGKQGEPAGEIILHDVNPVGRGYCEPGKKSDDGGKLPNLEDPANLIKQPGDSPAPMGFGFIAPTWKPRIEYVGTYDDAWQKNRAPYLPENFSNQFFNAAPVGLVCNEYQKGGELVILVGVCPEGPAKFRLPEIHPKCSVSVGGRIEKPEMLLETIVFEPDERRFSMTWRASLKCDKEVLKVQAVQITE